MAKNHTFDDIAYGDTVVFLTPNGIGRNGVEWKEKTGRATIKSPGHWALNCGGKHGTPGLVTPDNFVRISKKRK